MREITVDLRGFQTAEELHESLARLFDFPEYYGKNLDALCDLLTERFEDTRVCVRLPKTPEADGKGAEQERGQWRFWYAARVLRVLRDAAAENGHLQVEVKEADGSAASPAKGQNPGS